MGIIIIEAAKQKQRVQNQNCLKKYYRVFSVFVQTKKAVKLKPDLQFNGFLVSGTFQCFQPALFQSSHFHPA